jgi:hypothetical protein
MNIKNYLKFIKISPILFIGFFSNAQVEKDSLLKKDILQIFEELKFMYDYDQALREYPMYKTFNKHFTDSIESLPETEVEKYKKENSIQSDNLNEFIHLNYIFPFDKSHTKRLIEITQKYGFPSVKRLNRYLNVKIQGEFNPMILFLHSPKEFWEESILLMTNEFKLGNIDNCTYGYLMWHFHGRSDVSYMLNNGFKFVTENSQQRLKAVDCGDTK